MIWSSQCWVLKSYWFWPFLKFHHILRTVNALYLKSHLLFFGKYCVLINISLLSKWFVIDWSCHSWSWNMIKPKKLCLTLIPNPPIDPAEFQATDGCLSQSPYLHNLCLSQQFFTYPVFSSHSMSGKHTYWQ